MAGTQIQNCQRGIIFLTFLFVLFFTIFKAIALIKKLIDPVQQQVSSQKYKQGQQPAANKQKKQQDSSIQFDQAIANPKNNEIKQDDPTAVKIIKKTTDLQYIFFPMFLIFTLNIVTGTSKAFSLVNYFFTTIAVFLFNVLKLHKGSIQNKIVVSLLQNLYLILLFFGLVNIWGATPVMQPYIIVAS